MAYTTSLADWLNSFNNLAGADYSAVKDLVSPVGGTDWAWQGDYESSDKVGWQLSPEAQARLSGYSVNADARTDGEDVWHSITSPTGASAGDLMTEFGKESAFDKFNYGGGMVALLGAAGLFGPGGLLTGEGTTAAAAGDAGIGSLGSTGTSVLSQQVAPNIIAEAVIPQGLPTLESLGASGGILSPGSLPALTAPVASAGSAAGTGASFMDKLTGLMKTNPNALLQAGGLLGGMAAKQPEYSGPMPTISRGDWKPAQQAQTMPQQSGGLLQAPQGYANSGLWRFMGQ